MMKQKKKQILNEERLKKQKNKNKEQNQYVLAGENIYDIKEQKRLLEEFERKKKKEKEKIKKMNIINQATKKNGITPV